MSQVPSAVGLTAPDFTAESTSGPFQLSSLQGRKLVLYFYPKDNTPGCTTEAGQFRDLHTAFCAADCVIVGVSRDSLKSHAGFRAKLELPFDLIADTDEILCRMFDVIKPKSMYGKTVIGIERSTFLIDREGILRQEWRRLKVDGHAQAVLEAARALP